MTTLDAPTSVVGRDYLQAGHSIRSWLLSVDHKRIGVLYLIGLTLFFLVGGFAAVLMRLELMTPEADMDADIYNRMFTAHGVLMVFFFLIPSIPGALGNFLLPIMIGARDMAFPRLNLASWYLFMTGGIMVCVAVFFGGANTGWTFYTPYSSVYAESSAVFWMALGIFIAGFGSILTGLNFIVTVHTMRAPGMTWFRMPLFVWANYATALIMLLGTPVLAITIACIALERTFGIPIFDPRIGGDPLLFQHLFWFYSHPAVYIMILPAMGVMSELVTCFSRRPIFGYTFIAASSLAIAVLGFLVWGHHMFVSGQSPFAGMVFSLLSFLVAVPSAIKVFNWTATLHKGQIYFKTPMLYAGGFIGLFTIGGLTGLFLASLAVDVNAHDTYFVVAHFHYIMVGGAVMGYLGGIHFWWPKMTGKMYPEGWGIFSAILVFVGFNLTFFPQFLLGWMGMPRRYAEYPAEWQVLNVMSTAGASILGFAYLFPLTYLLWSLRFGRDAGPNPWNAAGLEWQTSSPPITHNFEKTPVVTFEAYAYDHIEGGIDASPGQPLPGRDSHPMGVADGPQDAANVPAESVVDPPPDVADEGNEEVRP